MNLLTKPNPPFVGGFLLEKKIMKYIANQSVGRFATGDEVLGLTDERAKELLAIGAIKAVPSDQEPQKGNVEPLGDEPSENDEKTVAEDKPKRQRTTKTQG